MFSNFLEYFIIIIFFFIKRLQLSYDTLFFYVRQKRNEIEKKKNRGGTQESPKHDSHGKARIFFYSFSSIFLILCSYLIIFFISSF